MFQHTAARRRLAYGKRRNAIRVHVSTHSRPKAAGPDVDVYHDFAPVSTHSRPKAAGRLSWARNCLTVFQHTAARRRLVTDKSATKLSLAFVSTHSRPKAAGRQSVFRLPIWRLVSTHSRPKAAGASLKSLAPSGFAAPSSLSSQEKRECEYNTAFSVAPAFAIS